MEDEGPEDDRTIELSSIAAIFPELQVDPSDAYHATLDLSVTPIVPLKIAFAQPTVDSGPPQLPTPPTSVEQGKDEKNNVLVHTQNSGGDLVQREIHELAHLPPLQLDIRLGEDYPHDQPPNVHVTVIPPWLPLTTLRELEADAEKIWEEMGRDQTIYSYIDHLQQQAENGFNRDTATQPLNSDLKLALLDFDLKTKRQVFENGTFDCGICLEPKKGKDCHKLMLCGHVFCVACLQDFYNNCVTEGDIDNVKCMDPTCGRGTKLDDAAPRKRRKRDRTLNPSELLQIPIEQELVQRYVRLKRKKKLELDKNTIYCPRQWCQGAAKSKKHPKPNGDLDDFSESDSEVEAVPQAQRIKKDPESIPMSQRVAICEDCDYAFCMVCKKGWHGERANCSPRREAELKEEEKATNDYIQKYSSPCPTCDAPCQKTMGCNHMICFKCNTHFCYLCCSYLMPDNPYKHFNDPQGRCYQRLWVLEGGDGNELFDRHNNPDIVEDWFDPADEPEPEQAEDLQPDVPIAILAGQDFDREEIEPDSDDSEPAPDVRQRERAIEIVNFAGNGANVPRRIVLPERPRPQDPPPPPAPNPPARRRRRGQGQPAHRQQQMQREPARADLRPAAPAFRPRAQLPVQAPAAVPNDEPPPAPLPRPAPGQEAPNAAQQRALDRFLELAQRDEEDEWDSDELDEDDMIDDHDNAHDHEAEEFRGLQRLQGRRHVRWERNEW